MDELTLLDDSERYEGAYFSGESATPRPAWAVAKVAVVGLLAVALTTLSALFPGSGVSHASLDNQQSLIDNVGDTLTVQQWDTFLNGVTPLDRNRLTREWFQSGRVAYTVTGPHAAHFTGTLELGYQVSFPWALGVGLRFFYSTPNLLQDGTNLNPLAQTFDPLNYVVSSNLVPGVAFSADLGNGPGLEEVATFAAPVSGPAGTIRISNSHGTVTGAAGGVVLRPYARLTSADPSDTVSTYGALWDMG